MKQKTLFTPESFDNLMFYVQDKMMLMIGPTWSKDDDGGKGDALWRTGWAYITYGEKIFKEGILSCFTDEVTPKGKKYIQAHRYPDKSKHNVSRDQITSALAALHLNGDIEDVRRIVKGLRWKLSKNDEVVDKFMKGKPNFIRPIVSYFADAKITIDMWLWMKSLASKYWLSRVIYGSLFAIIQIFIIFFSNIWNVSVKKWGGMKVCTPEELNKDRKTWKNAKDISKKIGTASKLSYPTYAFHLFSWQLYTSQNNPFKWLCKKMSLMFVDKSNYVLKLLFGGKVKLSDIKDYKAMSCIRWQRTFHRGIYDMGEIISENKTFKKYIDSTYNALDNDMMWYLVDKHPKQVND